MFLKKVIVFHQKMHRFGLPIIIFHISACFRNIICNSNKENNKVFIVYSLNELLLDTNTFSMSTSF